MSDGVIEISIITPAYNAGATLPRFLESLEGLDFDRDMFEVIIVDDGSTDDTREILARFQEKTELRFKWHSRDRSKTYGPAIAREEAIKKSRGRILAFSDADCVVQKNWLKVISASFEDENIAIIGGPIFCDEVLIFPWKYAPVLGVGVTANLAVDRKKTGVFSLNSEFQGLYGEDIDLLLRLEEAGFAFEFVKEMKVLHPANVYNLRQIGGRVLFRRNEVLLYKKYGNKAASVLHPIFRPTIFGFVSPIVLLVIGLSAVVALPLLFISVFSSGFIFYLLSVFAFMWGLFVFKLYEMCVFYRPASGGDVFVTYRARAWTFLSLLVYVPLFIVSRIQGSIRFRYLIL